MSEHYLGSQSSGHPQDGAILIERRRAWGGRRASDNAEDKDTLRQFAQEQLARDIADIERARAALQRAEPALTSWVAPAAMPILPKGRPLWLLIGALWISTALLTAGALVAIASLAGRASLAG
jgi:ABC-type multidrug transport system fused ATPase/permease subunit